MFPFNWVMIESPRIEFPEGLTLVHKEIFPTVPAPVYRRRLGVAAGLC
jgi:hypothetical protein